MDRQTFSKFRFGAALVVAGVWALALPALAEEAPSSSRAPAAGSAASAPSAGSAAPSAVPGPAPSAGSPAPAASTSVAAGPVLTLSAVERTALEHQPQIRLARANTSASEGQAEQARSPLLPQITGTGAYTRQTGNYAPRPGTTTNSTSAPDWTLSKSYDYWNFGLSATQLLYDFGQTSNRYRAAEDTVDAQRSSERTTSLQVLFNVRKAFFSARANKELERVARETRDSQKKHLEQVQAYVKVGIQPLIALAQQRAALANAEVQLITAENNYLTSKAQLNQAAGVVGGTDYEVSDEDMAAVPEEDQPLEQLFARAIESRPELTTLRKQREAAQATLAAIRGAYGPSLSASAGATEAGMKLDDLVPNWNVGLAVSWPVFQGGLTRGQVHQAEANLQGIDAQRSGEELQVRFDIDTARLAVRAAKATTSAVEEALASAREQLRLAEQRFATGVGSIIELVDAQVAYTSAAGQVVQAHYGLASARAQLLAALGRS